MLLAGRIETSTKQNTSVSGVSLVTGGFDTPFAIASGYSTTELFFISVSSNTHE